MKIPTTEETLKSRDLLSQCYNEQVELLLNSEMETWASLVEFKHAPPNSSPFTHWVAWNYSNGRPLSLFSCLPGLFDCASEIEHTSNISEKGWKSREYFTMRCKVVSQDHPSLPDVHNSAIKEDGKMFTREQLEEFARRQLVARFGA